MLYTCENSDVNSYTGFKMIYLFRWTTNKKKMRNQMSDIKNLSTSISLGFYSVQKVLLIHSF